jgi:hypothetical protein
MSKLSTLILIAALACTAVSTAQPVRMYEDKGAPPFKVLKEGENPPLDAYDNFVIGPKYLPAPERKKIDGVPEGKVVHFEFESKETKLFNPGIKRDKFGTVDPNNPKTLILLNTRTAPKRRSWWFTTDPARPTATRPFSTT